MILLVQINLLLLFQTFRLSHLKLLLLLLLVLLFLRIYLESLSLKYRPKEFEDVVEQGIATDFLKAMLKSGDYPHAILLTGPSGCGKTTLARIIANSDLECMYLIDIYSKEDLAKELSKNTNVEYVNNLSKVDFNTNSKLILINCAGKEGGDDKELKTVIKQLKNMNHIFVDLRPQLNIEIVNVAKEYGWDAYTGFGMNSRNDYVLLQKIQELTGIKIPSFKEFEKLVASAS